MLLLRLPSAALTSDLWLSSYYVSDATKRGKNNVSTVINALAFGGHFSLGQRDVNGLWDFLLKVDIIHKAWMKGLDLGLNPGPDIYQQSNKLRLQVPSGKAQKCLTWRKLLHLLLRQREASFHAGMWWWEGGLRKLPSNDQICEGSSRWAPVGWASLYCFCCQQTVFTWCKVYKYEPSPLQVYVDAR